MSEDLIRGILARTSGSPCGRARDLICARTDGAIETVDAELLAAHSAHCRECRAVAAAMVWMREPLRDLAEIDPGPGFTGEVMRRTLPLAARVGRRLRRLGEEWAALVRRPRIAWEAAYVGAALIGLIFAAPISPLRDVPREALRMAQANPVQALARVGRERVPETVVDWSDTAWGATGGRAGATLSGWRDGARDRLGRAWQAGRPLGGDISDLGAALWRGEGAARATALASLRDDLGDIWNELTTNQPQDSSGERP